MNLKYYLLVNNIYKCVKVCVIIILIKVYRTNG